MHTAVAAVARADPSSNAAMLHVYGGVKNVYVAPTDEELGIARSRRGRWRSSGSSGRPASAALHGVTYHPSCFMRLSWRLTDGTGCQEPTP